MTGYVGLYIDFPAIVNWQREALLSVFTALRTARFASDSIPLVLAGLGSAHEVQASGCRPFYLQTSLFESCD